MTHSACSVAALALVLGAAALARADDPPAGKDAAGDPLPKGAKFRFGNGRLVFGAARPSRHPFVLLGPDYKAMAHVEEAGALRRFDPVNGARLDKAPDEPAVPGPEATYVAVSADGKRMAVLRSRTGTIALRNAVTGEPIREVKYPAGSSAVLSSVPILSLSADGKVLAAGGNPLPGKSEASVWDAETGEVVFRAEILPGDPVPVALSPDGKLLATCGWDFGPIPNKPERRRVIQVWDVAGKRQLFRARSTTDGQYAVMAFSPDGTVLAFSCGDGVIDLWNAKTGRPREPLLSRTGQGAGLAFSPDSKTLAAISATGTIQRWTVADLKHVGATEPPVGADVQFFAHGVAFADAERVLGWGRVGTSPFVWEAPAGKPVTRLPEHTAAVRSVAFAAGGKELLTHGADDRILRWDATSGLLLGSVAPRLPRGVTTTDGLAFSPDGARIATLGRAPAVFDVATGSEEFALPPGMLFHPSPNLKRGCLIGAPAPGAVGTARCVVWDLVDRRKVEEVELAVVGGQMPRTALSPSGNRLVSVTQPPATGGKSTATITVWDLKTGTKLGQVVDEVKGAGLDVVVADDALALVRDPTGRLRVLDYETGKFGAEFEPEPKKLDRSASGPVVFSADRKRFAVGLPLEGEAWTHGVRVYEWPSGKPLRALAGHSGRVTAIAFSPGGEALATASADGTVLVWNLGAGK